MVKKTKDSPIGPMSSPYGSDNTTAPRNKDGTFASASKFYKRPPKTPRTPRNKDGTFSSRPDSERTVTVKKTKTAKRKRYPKKKKLNFNGEETITVQKCNEDERRVTYCRRKKNRKS